MRRSWTRCCTPNAYEAAPDDCTGATSTSYQTAHFAALDGAAFVIRGDTLLHRTPEGYGAREPQDAFTISDKYATFREGVAQ